MIGPAAALRVLLLLLLPAVAAGPGHVLEGGVAGKLAEILLKLFAEAAELPRHRRSL